jgi:hypothetical protein
MLRFFALQDLKTYEKPLKDHLSKYMRHHRGAGKKFLDAQKYLFEKTCKTVVASLGEKPFHIRAGLNAAVFDSVMIAISKHLNEIPATLVKKYRNLVEDDQYSNLTKSGTTNEETVRKRFNLAEKTLFD